MYNIIRNGFVLVLLALMFIPNPELEEQRAAKAVIGPSAASGAGSASAWFTLPNIYVYRLETLATGERLVPTDNLPTDRKVRFNGWRCLEGGALLASLTTENSETVFVGHGFLRHVSGLSPKPFCEANGTEMLVPGAILIALSALGVLWYNQK